MRTHRSGRYYDAEGRKLLLHRSGRGSPAVVFLPGGTVGLDYLNVQRRAAELTTSVVYDRAGTGWSDPGHSLGGFYARYYAARFPAEVRALLLMEPAHEDYNAYMPAELVEQWQAFDPGEALPDELPAELIAFYRDLLGQVLADWPAEIREPLIERHVSPEWLRTGFQEAGNVEQLGEEMRRAGPAPDVPLIILAANGIDAFKRMVSAGTSDLLLEAEIEGKLRLYREWAGSVRHGEVRVADGAGHASIGWTHPGAVVDAIRDLLG